MLNLVFLNFWYFLVAEKTKYKDFYSFSGNICCFEYYCILNSTLHREFETNIPGNETARPHFQFLHSCICERFFIFPRSVRLFCCLAFADRSWEYINCSQTQECRNWEWGCAVSFLGIFISSFWYMQCICSAHKHKSFRSAFPYLPLVDFFHCPAESALSIFGSERNCRNRSKIVSLRTDKMGFFAWLAWKRNSQNLNRNQN